MHSEVASCLAALREKKPVVHNITNQVVTNNTANALLAIGASPVMANAPEEMADMISIASALVINTGTPSEQQLNAMRLAITAATAQGKPWVLDPVGAGATPYRLQLNKELLALKPTAVRGNASEILTLLTGEPTGRGVDSEASSDDTLSYIQQQAQAMGTVLIVTGETDYIADGSRISRIHNGHPMMARVTGTGCTATALTGAFLASHTDPWLAATASIVCLGIAGEIAAEAAAGPGSLQLQLLDNLYLLDASTIAARLKLSR